MNSLDDPHLLTSRIGCSTAMVALLHQSGLVLSFTEERLLQQKAVLMPVPIGPIGTMVADACPIRDKGEKKDSWILLLCCS